MSTIEIKQVTNRKELKQFVQFYYDLYRGNNCAVPYLFFDEMATLRKDKNPSFECCEAEYFMAFRDGKMVGRVAAIINRRANERWNCHQVRFGWFDFIDDTAVSTALLQAVEQWGRSKGMNEIAGPHACRWFRPALYHVCQLQPPLLPPAHGAVTGFPESQRLGGDEGQGARRGARQVREDYRDGAPALWAPCP